MNPFRFYVLIWLLPNLYLLSNALLTFSIWLVVSKSMASFIGFWVIAYNLKNRESQIQQEFWYIYKFVNDKIDRYQITNRNLRDIKTGSNYDKK